MSDLHAIVHDSIQQIDPAEWSAFTSNQTDLAMDSRQIRALELCLADQCRMWTVLIRDGQGRAVTAAGLARFRVDTLDTTSPAVRALTHRLRAVLPNAGRFGVLFCGLPIPAGHSHLRLADDADTAAVVAELHRVMSVLAARHNAALLVWKEFDARQAGQLRYLSDLGYIRGDTPPRHTLTGRFDDLDDYMEHLQARYRQQITRSLKKLRAAGFQAESVTGSRIVDLYDDALHRLHLEVRDRSNYRLERFNKDFFRQLAMQFGERASLTCLRRGGQAGAFAFGITTGRDYHNLHIGVDYAHNAEADLYFNIHYADMDRAYRSGVSAIHLGQTADDFKGRLGTTAEPLCFYARATNPLVQWGLKTFGRHAFPTIPPPPTYHVFRKDIPPAGPAAASD